MSMRSVVVTGASSGIGLATAHHLARSGWRVFAGVRRKGQQPELPPGLSEVLLDVTVPESVSAAVEQVAAEVGDRGLDGLVNNAGIGLVFPMEHVPPQDLRDVFEINVFGLVATTQAFLPLLRQARGRIVNISSIGGLVTVPFGGALCATKRAVEAITDALRLELRPAGIHVSAIRPASIDTPAAGKLAGDLDSILAKLPPEGRERYEASIRHFMEEMQKTEHGGSPPEVVAHAVRTALEALEPHAYYKAGKHATLLGFLGRWVPDEVRDQMLLAKLGLPT